jgi:tight adherence protein B
MGQLILPIIFVLAFIAVVLVVQSISTVVMDSRSKTQRVNRRLTLLDKGMDHRAVYETLIRQRQTPQIQNASILNLYNRAVRVLSQAGLNLSPFAVLAIWLGAAAGIWIIVTFVLRTLGTALPTAQMVIALVGALMLTGLALFTAVNFMRSRRMRILEEQLPLALDIVVRSLRAGHPIVSALQLVTSEMGDPIGSEFGLIIDETTYGFELRDALANFARRTGSQDAHFFAVSVAIQAETGGNLAEILENLSKVIRGRITLGKRVKALSSEGRMSAVVLSLLPLFLIGSLSLSQPQYYAERWQDPIFWPVVGGVVMVYCLGLYMMHRIANFKY